MGKLVCLYFGVVCAIAKYARDSFNDRGYHRREQNNTFPYTSRGSQRYDPHSRKYVTWEIPHDWYGQWRGWSPYQVGHYPRFTQDEARELRRQIRRNGRINPERMGSDWHAEGPKVSGVLCCLQLEIANIVAAIPH